MYPHSTFTLLEPHQLSCCFSVLNLFTKPPQLYGALFLVSGADSGHTQSKPEWWRVNALGRSPQITTDREMVDKYPSTLAPTFLGLFFFLKSHDMRSLSLLLSHSRQPATWLSLSCMVREHSILPQKLYVLLIYSFFSQQKVNSKKAGTPSELLYSKAQHREEQSGEWSNG